MAYPNSETELECVRAGHLLVAGVDEVGRGCLAGPVVAAAVILDLDCIPPDVDDSKKLTAKTRDRLDVLIRQSCIAYAIGIGEVEEIDTINILQSSKAAMIRAIHALNPLPHFLLVDGNFRIESEIPQRCLVKGDQISVSIAAASIVAKVFRDRLMAEFDEKYPGYSFAKHKGYGSREHRVALEKLGPTPLHRKSFSWTPVREDCEDVFIGETL